MIFCFLNKNSNIGNVDYENLGDANYVISLISRHAILPENEIPQLAKISNPELFTGQNAQVFAGAHDGDLILFYKDVGRAYLYDPDSDKLINIVPVKQEK